MNNVNIVEKKDLEVVLKDFIESYAQRDKSVEFSDWLESKLHQEIPDISKEASEQLTKDILGFVEQYDKTLEDLNHAISMGQTQEEWISDCLSKECADMSPDIVGERLTIVEEEFITSGVQFVKEMDSNLVNASYVVDEEGTEWNAYRIKEKAREVGKKAAFAAVAVAADATRYKIENGSEVHFKEAVGEVLQDGLKGDAVEVKAAIAGAVKVAAIKGLNDALPTDTPTEVICDMAGVAVEGAEALFDAANGAIAGYEAVDRIGRAGVAAGCRCAKRALGGILVKVPVIGPILPTVLSGLLDYMESAKFYNGIYTIVKDAAIATWEGMKEFGKRTVNQVKQFGRVLVN